MIEEGALPAPELAKVRGVARGKEPFPRQTRSVFLKKACQKGQSTLCFLLVHASHSTLTFVGVKSSIDMQAIIKLLLRKQFGRNEGQILKCFPSSACTVIVQV